MIAKEYFQQEELRAQEQIKVLPYHAKDVDWDEQSRLKSAYKKKHGYGRYQRTNVTPPSKDRKAARRRAKAGRKSGR